MSRLHDPADDARTEPEVAVNVTTLYGMRTRRGMVQLQIGQDGWQLSPAEARRIAMLLLDGAESADTDEFLMDTFIAELGLSDQQAASVLQRFRLARLAKYGGQI